MARESGPSATMRDQLPTSVAATAPRCREPEAATCQTSPTLSLRTATRPAFAVGGAVAGAVVVVDGTPAGSPYWSRSCS
jgi:hypothetical protein